MPHTAPAMLSLEEIQQEIAQGRVDTVIVAFPDMYGRLVGKRFGSRFFLDRVAHHGTHGCDYLLACDMDMDPVSGYRFTSWNTGYGDFVLRLDWSTARKATWLDRTALILCDVFDDKTQKPVDIAPREILRTQLNRLSEMGYRAMGATEVEFFIFKETYESAREKQYHNLKTFGDYIEDYHILQGTKDEELVADIRRHLESSGIPVECSKGEWGPGQHELNLQYGEILVAADRHIIYKQACKELAHQKGLAVTFMAKWHKELAGNSQHIHVSLWGLQSQEQNAFVGERSLGDDIPLRVSDVFMYFLGGLIAHLREIALFLAPNINSYKRFQAASFAPTRIAWARDNRTTALRVVGEGASLRVECRVAGADANPYLAFAALIAAGMDGIQRRTEPPPIYSGNAYQDDQLPQVPQSLKDAIAASASSDFLQQALGENVVEHYLHFARVEQVKFDESVTDWERARYFERI